MTAAHHLPRFVLAGFSVADRGLMAGSSPARHRRLLVLGTAAGAVAMLVTLLAAVPEPAAAQTAGGAATLGPVRVVRYPGYEVRVPAAWPVYRLAADPSRPRTSVWPNQ